MSITPIGVTNPVEHPRRPDGTRYEWTDWKKLYYLLLAENQELKDDIAGLRKDPK